MATKRDLNTEFKKEYESLADLLEAMPIDAMLFKRPVEVNERRTGLIHDLLVLVFVPRTDPRQHYSDRCVAFMRSTANGKMRIMESERLRKELAEKLVDALDKKAFIDDYVMTLDPMELMEAYDRAVVKEGKVKGVEGCYKFRIYGQKGKPFDLQVRQ